MARLPGLWVIAGKRRLLSHPRYPFTACFFYFYTAGKGGKARQSHKAPVFSCCQSGHHCSSSSSSSGPLPQEWLLCVTGPNKWPRKKGGRAAGPLQALLELSSTPLRLADLTTTGSYAHSSPHPHKHSLTPRLPPLLGSAIDTRQGEVLLLSPPIFLSLFS